MAKVVEEKIVIKVSYLVKDTEDTRPIVTSDIRSTIESVVGEVLGEVVSAVIEVE